MLYTLFGISGGSGTYYSIHWVLFCSFSILNFLLFFYQCNLCHANCLENQELLQKRTYEQCLIDSKAVQKEAEELAKKGFYAKKLYSEWDLGLNVMSCQLVQ